MLSARRFIIDSHHRNGKAFVVIPCGDEEFVALCELRTREIEPINSEATDAEAAALLEVDARAAFKELYRLGVFPLPLTRLFVAVRKSIEEEVDIDDDGKDSAQPKAGQKGGNVSNSEGGSESDAEKSTTRRRTRLERRTVVDVFDGVNCLAVPFSHSKRPVKSNLRARLHNIVEDSSIALDAVSQSCGVTTSCGSVASFCVRAAGSLNIWDNSSQGHLLAFGGNVGSKRPNTNNFMSASQLVAAGDVVRMHSLVKSATEVICRNESSASPQSSLSSSLVSSGLSFVFGSTVGEGLSRPAVKTSSSETSSNSSNLASVALEQANPFSLVYMDVDAPRQTASGSDEMSMRVAHHLGMLISHVLAVPPLSLELTALPRSMVAIPQTLIPIIVPLGDAAARRRVHELLCLPRFRCVLNDPHALLCSLADPCPRTLAEAITRGREIVAGRINSPPNDKGALFCPIRLVNKPETSEELNRYKNKVNDGKITKDEVNIATLGLVKSIPKSETYLSADAFDFYHYRVDGFNDEGWGCAYRSLQTVLSWLRLRGMMSASAPIPTIREIQGILALADPDKEKRAREFVGSSEWIGTYEAMLVLQHFCPDLECALLRVESGADLETSSSVQRQISDHFARGGCPMIIGGSQYAHVIAGINANVRSGNAQYLIVDPHNKEANAAKAVQRGFVGWKEVGKVFDAKSWYNVCIPKVYDIDLS